MKRYRSKRKGPLPVGLKSGSISVASKGYFNVDGDDLTSPDLLTKIRKGLVELIEETVVVDTGEDPAPPPEEAPEPPGDTAPGTPQEEGEDVTGDEKDDDSLTSSSEMVESEDEETGSDDAESADGPEKPKQKQKKRKARGGKARNTKKGISG